MNTELFISNTIAIILMLIAHFGCQEWLISTINYMGVEGTLSAFPVLTQNSEPLAWILYSIVGIIIPVVLAYIGKNLCNINLKKLWIR